ncbi:gamma-glutamylcyclotransferase-like [Argonauta hians]
MTGKFFYFAFGSNLLKERLLLKNKTAVFKTTAKLENYQLKFGYKSTTWFGHAATIVESKGNVVWGSVYEMNNSNLESLDKQEGVDRNVYRPIEVKVEDPTGVIYNCRSYQLLKTDYGDPSPQYKDVIVRGALASGIPNDYIEFLKSIPHNGNQSKVPIYDEILSLVENTK